MLLTVNKYTFTTEDNNNKLRDEQIYFEGEKKGWKKDIQQLVFRVSNNNDGMLLLLSGNHLVYTSKTTTRTRNTIVKESESIVKYRMAPMT